MKKILYLPLLILSVNLYAQKPRPCAAMTVATDFTKVMTTIGLDVGLMSNNRKHSLMFTVHAESISNDRLIDYNREDQVKYGIMPGRECVSVGLKYAPRLFQYKTVEMRGVVHPWYAHNVNIKSAYFGGRIDFNHKGDMIGVELVRDPFGGRSVLRFVFTAFKK